MRLLHSFILSACLLSAVVVLTVLQNRYYSDRSALSSTYTQEDPNPQNTKPNHKTITLHNNITKQNTGYKHWTGRYYPSTFALRINDTLLEPEGETFINVIDNQFTVRIDYSFVNGYKKGGIIAIYELLEELPIHACNFISWTEGERLTIEGARYVSHEKDDFDDSVNTICSYQ